MSDHYYSFDKISEINGQQTDISEFAKNICGSTGFDLLHFII